MLASGTKDLSDGDTTVNLITTNILKQTRESEDMLGIVASKGLSLSIPVQ